MSDTSALHQRKRTPYKIGVCMEFAGGTRLISDFYDGVRLMLDEACARGDIDRPVELVVREVQGPMRGTNPAVLKAWRELAFDERCLAIIGPVVTEANLALVDEVNAARVPTISFCATFDWAGPYCYALQNGGFADEAVLLAAYLARQDVRRVAVFREDGIIGEEYFGAFKVAAKRYGVRIAADQVVGLFNTYEPVEPQLEAVRAAGIEAIVVFSAYGALPPVQAAITRMRKQQQWRRLKTGTGGAADAGPAGGSWNPLLIQNTTWVQITAFGGAGDYDYGALVEAAEGWIGLDQIHERNRTFQAALDRFEQRYGRRPFHAYTALGLDHGMVVADALARMKPPSPEGFKQALDRTRMREACIGAPGTVISFGPHDQRGYKGDYVVFRTVREGREQLVDLRWADLLQVEPPKLGVEDGAAAQLAQMGGGTRYSLVGARTPHRVGLLQDWALWAPIEAWYKGLQMAFDEAFENGVVDRPIEIVRREVEGPPEGAVAAVQDAYRQLVHDEQVLAVVGPFITDMTRTLRDEVERVRVPTLSYCATMYFAGDYCFQLPNGTFADETALVVRHLVDRGVRSVGVVREDNPIGDEYYDFFRQHARRLGLALSSDQIVSQRVTREEMRAAIGAIRASGAQALAHLGYGLAFHEAMHVMQEMAQQGWDVPRMTITTWVMYSGLHEPWGSPALMNLPADPALLEGWVGVDLPHEGNEVFRAFRRRYAARYGTQEPFCCYPAHMYDIGRALAEAIARARPVTPQGVKRGLEQVRLLPATMGAPGTVISFGPYDHRGYKSPDYLVLRTVSNGREHVLT